MSNEKTGDGGKPVPGSPSGSTNPANSPGGDPGQSKVPTTGDTRAFAPPVPGQKPAAPPPAGGPPPKPAPKNPGMVTCTIDGKEVVVKPGTNMVEAAKLVGSEIPYYCYHPRLSIAANCRMCLVEASNSPKLVPACQTPLAEGVAIKTTTPKVTEQQRAVLEFLLLNHPVDCSICDQAGECKLQDYYMRHDHKPSRLEGPKVLKSKRKVLGPQVVLDQERCILCTRCVRFMSEVAKEPQLGVFGRGSHEAIDTFPGVELTSNYSVNTVDICPVGALTQRDFRFRARAWFLSAAPSVCTGCSRGCNTFADFFGQDVHRYRPRENEQVNKSWMCDHGRLTYKSLVQGRVASAITGRRADAHLASPTEAVKYAAVKLKDVKGMAVLASPVASNEDLLATLSFAKANFGTKVVYVGGRPSAPGDDFLLTSDRNPNRKGLEWIAKGLGLELKTFEHLQKDIGGSVKSLWAIGNELPTADVDAFATLCDKLDLLIVQATNESPLNAAAHVVLPAATHVEDEGSFVNVDGLVQRFRKAYPPRGEAQPHWKWVSELARELGLTTSYQSAREAFRAHAPSVTELATFDWDKSAPFGGKKTGINPLPTGADGRPPGYREVGAPRVRGI